MKHFRNTLLISLFFFSVEVLGQSGEKPEMADVLRRDGKIYTVVIALTIMLTAMIILLIRVDRKLFRMEKQSRRSRQGNI
jgi:hypothetical protein